MALTRLARKRREHRNARRRDRGACGTRCGIHNRPETLARALMMQYIRTTVVSQSSTGFASIVPILLCAPKYVGGTMTLGEVMQAASAFVIVQVAFSWLVDNYPRLADWTASASPARIAVRLTGRIGACGTRRHRRGASCAGRPRGAGVRLRDLSVTLDDGSAVVNEADVEIAAGEKVLVVGESGTGKSTLVRANRRPVAVGNRRDPGQIRRAVS